MELSGNRPLISAVLATFNESAWIESSLGSLMSQRIDDCDLELLVIDGLSTDDTREKVAALAKHDSRIRLLLNPAREIPFAWNIGLRESKGQYLCTLGAHNNYDPTYLETCVQELRAHEAVACSGRVIVCARDQTLQAALCAWVLAHPFGSSASSFRTQSEGFVDSPAFPVFLKSAVAAVGGWDEQLFRAEDNDMSRKLAAAGGRFWCTGKTTCRYYGKSTLSGLLRYAYRNGLWTVITARQNRNTMHLRHFVPFVFVLCNLLCAASATFGMVSGLHALLLPLACLLGSHFVCDAIAAIQIALQQRTLKPLVLPPVFLGFHLAYGCGSLISFLTNAQLPKPMKVATEAANSRL